MKSAIIAAAFIACAVVAARGIAALPQLMRGAGIGPVHTSHELLFEILNGDFN
jgi:hypothetical protein